MARKVAAALVASAMLLGVSSTAVLAQQTPTNSQSQAVTADQRLKALYEAEHAWRVSNGIGWGNSTPTSLPRVDAKTQASRLAHWENTLKQLDNIPYDQLSHEEQINADIFRKMVEIDANEVRWKVYETPFNTDSFFWSSFTPQAGRGFSSAKEYQNYIARLKDVPRFFDENIVNMRAGLKRSFSIPKEVLKGRDATIVPYTNADESNPLFGPFKHMPTSIPASEQQALKAEALSVLKNTVAPAYANMLTFVRTEYMAKARPHIGASEMPNGREFYRVQARDYTTTDLTPAEIHQIGLKEVARIKADMEKTMRETGFKGTLPEFMAFLRTDPQFYAKTPYELLALSAYVVKKADAALKDVIGTLPRYRHGIIAVPDDIAPVYTAGRGGLENCLMNTYDLPSRPLYAIPALSLHECTPGHSFQAALALEAPERPDFRKRLYFSGYGEGWGLYTEYLGIEMGIYETPYQEFGRQTYEQWRAVRLVIDTGMHEYGWSRQQAIDYFKAHVALSDLEITNEVDRYISWPGQALAYKLGEIKIRELRKEAEAQLGDKFDLRGYHDLILGMGAVPLTVMESEIRRWIKAQSEKA